MDDDKSITEKLTDVIIKATDSVKSTMSNIVDTAAQAAQHAMESNAENISGQTVAQLDPWASDAAAMPAPLFVQPVPKRKKKRPARLNSAKISSTPKKAASKTPASKAAKKAARKPAKKSAPKKSKKTARKTSGKNPAKKPAKKSARKNKKRSKR